MKDKFFIYSNTNIILYGAASIGILTYQALAKKKIKVVGFIDQRAYEIIERYTMPVWSIDNIPTYIDKKNVVVIVAVKNVFDHDEIVLKLKECGFENILYKPSAVIAGYGDSKTISISTAYDNILNGLACDFPIAKTFEIQRQKLVDNGVKIDLGQYKVCMIPTELVYTDFYNGLSIPFADVSIYALYPHVDFFRFLGGDINAGYHHYIDFCSKAAESVGQIEVTDDWKMYTIKNRSMIYEQMTQSLELDFDFFVRNAPNATFNNRGYFNLISGKHRAAFFTAKKLRYMPLKLESSDYDKYINHISLKALISYMEKNEIYGTTAPIPHPFFYKFSCNNMEFFRIYLSEVVNFIAKRSDLNKIYILDKNNDDGYIARFFAKAGGKVTRAAKGVLETLLNDTLMVKSIKYEESDAKSSYDICLCSEENIPNVHAKCIIAIVSHTYQVGKVLFNGYLNGKLVKVVAIDND